MARTAPGPLQRIRDGLELLRWNHPSGRLILLIPAGWALWLNPAAPPSLPLLALIVLGGLAVSGAGCVANDLSTQPLSAHLCALVAGEVNASLRCLPRRRSSAERSRRETCGYGSIAGGDW